MLSKSILIAAFFYFTVGEVLASDAWNPKSNFGGVGRHRGTGVAIGTKGYIGLGHYNGAGPNIMFADWWEYDPSTNSWSQKADYPFPTYAAASFSIGMKCYVGAGVSAGSLFYEFDPIANTWTSIADVPLGTTDQIGFSINGKGYYLYTNQLYEYDPLLDVWTAKTSGPFGWVSWPSAFVIDNKVYVKAGFGLYEYKPTTDQWIARAPFPGLADAGSASFAVNGKGYIICGYIGWLSQLSDEVWEFDPALNTWTLLSDFPGSGRRFSSSFNIGNKGYLGIGTTGTNMRDFWEFDKLLSEEELVELHFNIYPNPVTTTINIDLDESYVNNCSITLYQIDGKVVYMAPITNSKTTFYRNNLVAGTYFYSVATNEKTIKSGQLIFE